MARRSTLFALAMAACLAQTGSPAAAGSSDWELMDPDAARIRWDGPGLESTRRFHQKAEAKGLSELERALWQDSYPVARLSITYVALAPNRVFISNQVQDLDDQIRAWFAPAPAIVLHLPDGKAGVPSYAQWQTRRFRIANPDGHCLAFRQYFGGTTWYDYLQGQGLEDGQGLGTRAVLGWACSPDAKDIDASRIAGCISIEPYIRQTCGHPLAPAKGAIRDARGEPRAEPSQQAAKSAQ